MGGLQEGYNWEYLDTKQKSPYSSLQGDLNCLRSRADFIYILLFKHL